MSYYPTEIPKPKNDTDFENMCAHIYGVIKKDDLPQRYGRSGQAQHGIDIVIQANNIQNKDNRIGIQCKHVKKLSFDHTSGDSICAEVNKVVMEISHLIIATTLPSDATLIQQTQTLSDTREAEGKFTVSIGFWGDIEQAITNNPFLNRKYHDGNDYVHLILESSKDSLNKGTYSAILTQLESATLDLVAFTCEQKIERLHLLSLSHCYMGELEKARQCIQDAMKIEEDHPISINISIIIEQYAQNIEVAQQKLENALSTYPESIELQVSNLQQQHNTNTVLPDFLRLNEKLQNNSEVNTIYLSNAIKNKNYEWFFEKFKTLPCTEKEETTKKYLYLMATIHKMELEQEEKISSLITDSQKDTIQAALQAFSTRHTTLWKIEHIYLRNDIIWLLFCVYSYIKHYDDALALFQECEQRKLNHLNAYLKFYIKASAYKSPALFSLAIKKYLLALKKTDLVEYAKLALSFKQENTLLDLFEQAKQQDAGNNDITTIQAMIWQYQLQTKPEQVLNSILESDILQSQHEMGLCTAANALFIENHSSFNDYNNAVIALSKQNTIAPQQNSFGIYFSRTKQYLKAIPFLEPIVNNYSYSDTSYLYECLLDAYINTSHFQKAKLLIEKVAPEDYRNSSLRHFVFLLAEKTDDFNLITDEIVGYQEDAFPWNAWTWQIKIFMAKKRNSKGNFNRILKTIPIKLEGEIQDINWIAREEMLGGLAEKGLQRNYNYLRSNLQSTEAYDGYGLAIVNHIMGEYTLPPLNKTLNTVIMGCQIEYADATKSHTIIIDQTDGLPQNEDFIAPSSPLATAMLGKKVRDTFSIQSKMGITTKYCINKITPLFLAAYHLVLKKASNPNFDSKYMQLIPCDTKSTQGKENFIDTINDMVQTRALAAENAYENYQKYPCTIGRLAMINAIETYKLIYDWTNDNAIQLSVEQNIHEKQQAPIDYIQLHNTPCVVDAITLIELAFNDSWAMLENLENITISTTTEALIDSWLQAHKQKNSASGTLVAHEKKLLLIENTPDASEYIFTQLQKIKAFITDKCYIQAAYGAEEINLSLLGLEKILSEEENATLRLCKEENYPLFAMDSRLREWAAQNAIQTITPNAYFTFLYKEQKIGANEYHFSIAKQFCNNRKIGAFDLTSLVWCCAQDTQSMHQILHTIKNKLLFTEDAYHATHIVTLFLKNCTLSDIVKMEENAFSEILKYLLQPILNTATNQQKKRIVRCIKKQFDHLHLPEQLNVMDISIENIQTIDCDEQPTIILKSSAL